MITISEEISDDRKLFKKLYKQNISSLSNAEPHILNNSINSTFPQKLPTIIKSIENKIIYPMLSQFQSQITLLEQSIEVISKKVHRIEAYVKMKKNSPRKSKNTNQRSYQTPSRGNWHKDNQQTPATTAEKLYEYGNKLGKQQQSPYLAKEFQMLKLEITSLRNHLVSTHPHQMSNNRLYDDQVSPLAASSSNFPLHLVNFTIPSISDSSKYSPTNQIAQRYEILIKQYEKKQQKSHRKIKKYQKMLQNIVIWLRNLKNVELQKLLPCQACEMKNMLKDYLTTDGDEFERFTQQHKTEQMQKSHCRQLFAQKPHIMTRQRKESALSSPLQSPIKRNRNNERYFQTEGFNLIGVDNPTKKLYERSQGRYSKQEQQEEVQSFFQQYGLEKDKQFQESLLN